jgi:hypothetical protein
MATKLTPSVDGTHVSSAPSARTLAGPAPLRATAGAGRRGVIGRRAIAAAWPVDWVNDAPPLGVALVAYMVMWDLCARVHLPAAVVFAGVALILGVAAAFVGAVPAAYLGGMAVCFYSACTQGNRLVLDVPGHSAAFAGLLAVIVVSRIMRAAVLARR